MLSILYKACVVNMMKMVTVVNILFRPDNESKLNVLEMIDMVNAVNR